MNNFRKIADFEYKDLFTEIANKPLWNWLNLRGYVGHSDDIILRYQTVQGDRTQSISPPFGQAAHWQFFLRPGGGFRLHPYQGLLDVQHA